MKKIKGVGQLKSLSFEHISIFGKWRSSSFLQNSKSISGAKMTCLSRALFRQFSRNIQEIHGFQVSENLLLNNRTLVKLTHWSPFFASQWHFRIQTKLVFWIFEIENFGRFWATFELNIPIFLIFGQKWPINGQ